MCVCNVSARRIPKRIAEKIQSPSDTDDGSYQYPTWEYTAHLIQTMAMHSHKHNKQLTRYNSLRETIVPLRVVRCESLGVQHR